MPRGSSSCRDSLVAGWRLVLRCGLVHGDVHGQDALLEMTQEISLADCAVDGVGIVGMLNVTATLYSMLGMAIKPDMTKMLEKNRMALAHSSKAEMCCQADSHSPSADNDLNRCWVSATAL